MVGFFLEKNPMTNKIKKFLYTLEHLIPDGHDEIPTFALYHPLLGWEELHLPSVLSLPCHHRTRRVPDSDPLGPPVPGHRVLRVRDELLATHLVSTS